MDAARAIGAGQVRHGARGRMVALGRSQQGKWALYAGSVALVAVAYYAVGRLGLELAYLDGAVAAVWPPAGLGLAVLFLYGPWLWPGVVIGDLWLGDYSTPTGAAIGPSALRLGGVIAADELGRVVRTWTLGDAAGVLVVAPFLLTWAGTGM